MGLMTRNTTETLRENCDRLSNEYAVRLFDELRQKPLDRETAGSFCQTDGRARGSM